MTPVACVCENCSIRLEGSFELSPLALLGSEDQAIAIAFIRSYGNIRKLQSILDVSYPTARSRLDRLVERLNRVMSAPGSPEMVLRKLEAGEIDVHTALEEL
ncbi:DUF2089 family protein [Candidatus Fermentibacterales bacterium]|nr:DUF2089 family protein [Candidatus Fermentibacterales bacterium]